MTPITLKKGFKLPLKGVPDISTIQLPEPETVAVSALDIPYIRPKLLIKEGEAVQTGTPLFCDKRNRCILYLSPGTGTVKKIVFGPRRKLLEVIIQLDPPVSESFVEFKSLTKAELASTPQEEIVKLLQDGGLWQGFRQFPAKDTADETTTPPMIIVSLNGNDIFSPHPGVILDNSADEFEFGLSLLRQLTKRVVVTCRKDSLKRLNGFQSLVTHTVEDFYPAWDPGTVLYKLKQTVEENHSWTISIQHLLLMARLLKYGRYPVKRTITVTRFDDKKPHIIARQGAPVKELIGQMDKAGVITTGRFNGRAVDPDSHLGFFEDTLNIIPGTDMDEMFGFMMPGFTTPSVSKTYLSSLTRMQRNLDCTIHGEERACINCGYCTKICPVDLHPNFIMKALHSDEIEEALNLGLLDCTRCGLCSFTCPSKIELAAILKDGITSHFLDKA
jgi:Na+-transporting NADH:ubiquinone oxidoreductase subunit A